MLTDIYLTPKELKTLKHLIHNMDNDAVFRFRGSKRRRPRNLPHNMTVSSLDRLCTMGAVDAVTITYAGWSGRERNGVFTEVRINADANFCDLGDRIAQDAQLDNWFIENHYTLPGGHHSNIRQNPR